MSSKRKASSLAAIPQYFLYGETNRDVDQQFLHVETIDSRSRQHDWSIKPHVHAELHHLLFIEEGGGQFYIDAESISINGPVMVSVPAQCVHSFAFDSHTVGWIITSSCALLQRIARVHPEFESLLYQPTVLKLQPEQSQPFKNNLELLIRESVDQQVAHGAAVESIFLSILVDAVRAKLKTDAVTPVHHDSDVELVSRYKILIEKHFHERIGAAEYAAQLCVCHESLRSACVRITGTSPLALLNARRLLEAKRYLLYTNANIAEVAYRSGFEDPAYFSRFFARSTGNSPRTYRVTHNR